MLVKEQKYSILTLKSSQTPRLSLDIPVSCEDEVELECGWEPVLSWDSGAGDIYEPAKASRW